MCDGPYGSDAGSNPLMQQNFDKAKQLLQEAGCDGRPVVLMDATDIATNHYAALVTTQLLKKIGLNVELQAMDWSTVVARRANKKPVQEGGWNLFHTGWIFRRPVHPGGQPGRARRLRRRRVRLVLQPRHGGAARRLGANHGRGRAQSLSADIQRLAMAEVPPACPWAKTSPVGPTASTSRAC